MIARVTAIAVLVALSGCERAAHNMYDGARDRPLRSSTRFADGAATRPAVQGTVEHAEGILAATSSGRASAPKREPSLARGHDRYDVYCSPCHSIVGDGDGRVVRRGFPRPPSFDEARLRAASDRQIFDAITEGYGVMYPFGNRIPEEDRWAIVAYVRALQRGGPR